MIYYLKGYEENYPYVATLQYINLFDIETRLTKKPSNSNPVLIPNIDYTCFNESEFDDEVVDNAISLRKEHDLINYFIQFTLTAGKNKKLKETLKDKYATILVNSLPDLIKYCNIPFPFIQELFYEQIISSPEIKEIKSLLHKLNGENMNTATIERIKEITESNTDDLNLLKSKLKKNKGV